MKYKKITCFLVTVCLAATLNGFPVIAMENDTAIQGELTDTISYDGVNEKPEEASTDTEESSPKAGTQEIEEPADQEEILEETAGSQENLRENSWRYQNGELISNSVSAYSNERAAANAWTKVNGNFISSSGEIIPNAIAKGIDISYHNGTINWDKVKNSDVDFVIIRCGYGDNYTSQDDKKWLENVQACESRGIPYGVYIYSYAENVAQAQSEADHVLRLIRGHKLSYPVFYDLEDEPTTGRHTNQEILNMTRTFCTAIQNAGYNVGVYANKYWFTSKLTDSYYDTLPKWVAQYNSKCTYAKEYMMWQCADDGKVNGISTRVDINFQMKSSWNNGGNNNGNNNGDSKLNGWQTEGGKRYYYQNGVKVCNLGIKIDGYWYYFDASGVMKQNYWRQKDGQVYYYDADGHMYQNAGAQLDGYWYYFDANGVMKRNSWREKDGLQYYYDADGHLSMNIGLLLHGYWHYFDQNGVMRINYWRQKNGQRYYYDADGHLYLNTGVKIDGYWYYFDNDGIMKANFWRKKDGDRYYYDANGHLVTNRTMVINGVTYRFSSSGKVI